jgi:hypothetical protein
MNHKPYVCTICSQDFTRKYSGNRHNWDLHNGQSKIVRMVDYVVGRISGQYHPDNPFAYRSKQKQYNPVGQMPEGSDLFKQKNRGDASNLDPTEMMRIAMGMA